jgi:hypothetical protein
MKTNRRRSTERHTAQLPSIRNIRRACSRELYRTAKRLNVYLTPQQMEQAEEHYFTKVIGNLMWIYENRSNRNKQAEWWAIAVAPGIAQIWKVDQNELIRAFKDGYRNA